MCETKFREFFIKHFVGFLKPIPILLSAVEVDFDPRFFDRRKVLLDNEDRIRRPEIVLVGRIAEDSSE